MKIKCDFVTNSSSTSFIFAFKHNIEGLYEMIRKYKSWFKLINEYDNYFSITHKDVINSLIDIKAEKMLRDIDEVLKETNETLDSYIENVKKYEGHTDLYSYVIKNTKHNIKMLERAKENGLDTVLTIGFGDNDGEISGPGIGSTMDYAGRYIDIFKEDFVVFTEQNR